MPLGQNNYYVLPEFTTECLFQSVEECVVGLVKPAIVSIHNDSECLDFFDFVLKFLDKIFHIFAIFIKGVT